jgi:hypothetical protein
MGFNYQESFAKGVITMSADLQDVNFRNLVSFYNAELRAIQSGKKAAEVLSTRERQKLKEMGIIKYGLGMSETRITEKALSIIDELNR